MNTNTLTKKFNNMVNRAANFRSIKVDGLDFWTVEKLNFIRYDNLSNDIGYTVNELWINQIDHLFKAKVLSNVDECLETVVPDHFIYQLVNLTIHTPLSIRRVMQLALNIGQWKSAYKSTEGQKIADEIFIKYNLDNIESYLKKEDIELLSKLL